MWHARGQRGSLLTPDGAHRLLQGYSKSLL